MIGIVILNYNDSDTTIKMINQIKSYKCLNDIIIVDNKSTDESYKKLKMYERNNIKVYETPENRGYSYGNNFGIKKIIDRDEFIIISNPDIVLKEEDIIRLRDDLRDKSISLIAPKISQNGKIIKGWRLPSITDDILSNINLLHRITDKRLRYSEYEYKDRLTRVDVVSGCFFMIRSKALKEIGLFDENTFLYYEENILGKRLKDKNLKSYIDNDVMVIHELSKSVDKSIKKINKYKILKRSQFYYEKEYNKANKFELLLLKITYYFSLFIAYITFFFR